MLFRDRRAAGQVLAHRLGGYARMPATLVLGPPRGGGPGGAVVAVPVGAPSTCDKLRALAEEVVCAYEPLDFRAVGQFYEDFSQTTDEEVRELLAAESRN